MLSLSKATFITGTTGAATARAVTLGQDNSTYQAGTITESGSEAAYAAKYDPNGVPVFRSSFQLTDNNNNNLNTEGNAVAVDGIGNVYVGGTYVDTAAVPHSYGVKVSADGTAISWVHTFVGPIGRTHGGMIPGAFRLVPV